MALINKDRRTKWNIVQRLNNGECALISVDELVDRYILKSEEWFAGRITRDLAEELVLRTNLPRGAFLIRESLTGKSGKFYALTIRDDDSCSGIIAKHYRIERDDIDGGFFIIIMPFRVKFKTLEKLVEHFRSQAVVLCCTLTYPALRDAPMTSTVSSTRENIEMQYEDQSCSILITRPKTNMKAKVNLAIETAIETVRAPLRDALCCTICQQVSSEPTLCVNCGQLVGCYLCVLTALEHNESCPLCRAAWSRSKLTGFIKSRMSFENVLGL